MPVGAFIDGPEKYFKIGVEQIAGNEVRSWYVADRNGNRSANLGGPGVMNIDLVLGQGRVAGQAILKDVGRAMAVRNTATASQAVSAPRVDALPTGMIVGIGVLALGMTGVGFEIGRWQRRS